MLHSLALLVIFLSIVLVVGADSTVLTDSFGFFDDEIWEAQCSGCTYQNGWLRIEGSEMFQRTSLPLLNLVSITSILKKNEGCDDHSLALSSHSALSWTLFPEINIVKFGWDCKYKMLIGQESSTNDICGQDETYTIDIGITDHTLSFTDDFCGTLLLNDNFGEMNPLVYVYLGADNDNEAIIANRGSAHWKEISFTYSSDDWPTPEPTKFLPSSQPTVFQPTSQPSQKSTAITITDSFNSYDEVFWESQCSGCTYTDDGYLRVNGNNMLQRTTHSLWQLSTISGLLIKDEGCDDHAIAVTPKPTFSWSYASANHAVKFGWNCGDKVLLGQDATTDDQCARSSTYAIEIVIADSMVSFSDDYCGTLSLSDDIGSISSSLYVYLGADNEIVSDGTTTGYAYWDQVSLTYSVIGDDDVISSLPSILPTSSPSPMPSTSTPLPTNFPMPSPTKVPLTSTSTPTYHPIPIPTNLPVSFPTHLPTPLPTILPVPEPTDLPIPMPSSVPIPSPTQLPIPPPTLVPYPHPSTVPIPAPSTPTPSPTSAPSHLPKRPSPIPSPNPTYAPILPPSRLPIPSPTFAPTSTPTYHPIPIPSNLPVSFPTHLPTPLPSILPVPEPTDTPIPMPSSVPISSPTQLPIRTPTLVPYPHPSTVPIPVPSSSPPTPLPTPLPTHLPDEPSSVPLSVPSFQPSPLPYPNPVPIPTFVPTPNPTPSPLSLPTSIPFPSPSLLPLPPPTSKPTVFPTIPHPSPSPSITPSMNPSLSTHTPQPSPLPTPSFFPSSIPSMLPVPTPTKWPTIQPIPDPTLIPSIRPSNLPTLTPTMVPSIKPFYGKATRYPSPVPTPLGTVALQATLVLEAETEDDVTEYLVVNSVAAVLAEVSSSEILHYSVVFAPISTSISTTSSSSVRSGQTARSLAMTVEATSTFSIVMDLSDSSFDSVDAFSTQITSELADSVADGSLASKMTKRCGGCSIEASSVETLLVQLFPSSLPTLQSQPTLSPIVTLSSSNGGNHQNANAASAGMIGGIVGGSLVLLFGMFYYRHRSKYLKDQYSDNMVELDLQQSEEIDMDELASVRRFNLSPTRGTNPQVDVINDSNSRDRDGSQNRKYHLGQFFMNTSPTKQNTRDRDSSLDSSVERVTRSSSHIELSECQRDSSLDQYPSSKLGNRNRIMLLNQSSKQQTLSKNQTMKTRSKELQELHDFLSFAELEKFANSFLEFGITSVDDMCDMSLITDAELMSEIGMKKLDVKKFRKLLMEKKTEEDQNNGNQLETHMKKNDLESKSTSFSTFSISSLSSDSQMNDDSGSGEYAKVNELDSPIQIVQATAVQAQLSETQISGLEDDESRNTVALSLLPPPPPDGDTPKNPILITTSSPWRIRKEEGAEEEGADKRGGVTRIDL